MIEFKVPEVGENIESGTVVDILVAVGEAVKKDQDLFEFETEKASLPVPSPCNGTIQEILIEEGDEVAIGQVVMKIDGEIDASAPAESGTVTETPKVEAAPQPTQSTSPAPKTPPVASAALRPSEQIPAQIDIPAAPSVRRFARETGVEVSQVRGSGPGGRISKDDVKTYIKQLLTGGMVAATPKTKPLPDFSKWGQIEKKPMSNIRKKTASHLSGCWETIPHVTQFDKADITKIEKIRKAHSTPDRKLTITPFLMKILAAALKEFPQFNSSVDMENKEVIYKQFVHIGVAVDTDRGLLVPVICDIDQKGIFDLTDELNAAAERARTKKTSLDELAGGSLTLTNLGGIGGTSFTPIVNWPEVAIMGVSRGRMEPVFDKEKGSFTPRFILPLSLSYDHRIVDGADGARFIRYIVEAIENPNFPELEK